jgi:hypothetical protein
MHKPAGMTTRTYVNHLLRINEQEIIHLSPFTANQSFSDDEIKKIIQYVLYNNVRSSFSIVLASVLEAIIQSRATCHSTPHQDSMINKRHITGYVGGHEGNEAPYRMKGEIQGILYAQYYGHELQKATLQDVALLKTGIYNIFS